MATMFQGTEGKVFVEEVPEAAGLPAELTISVFGSPWLVEQMKVLIQRGAATWSEAPAEIKGLADLVTSGRVMQDYNQRPECQKEAQQS